MRKMRKLLTSIMVLSLVLSAGLLSAHIVNATTIVKERENPLASVGSFTPRIITDNDYEEAVNSFDDGDVKYYLVTHDQN